MVEHDPIAGALDALGRDVETLPLASPGQVRRRGDVRRTRRTAATGLAAILMLAAGAGVAVGTLGGGRHPASSVASPPTSQATPTATTSDTTTPTQTRLDPEQAARAALLPATVLGPDARAEDRYPDGPDLNPCRYDTDEPHDVVLWRVISTPSGAEVHQRVIVWPSVNVAKANWVALHDDLAACPSASGRFGPLQISPMAPLEGGWAIELPSGAAPTQVYAAALIGGRVISEIYYTDPSAPAGAESVRQSQFSALTNDAAVRLAEVASLAR